MRGKQFDQIVRSLAVPGNRRRFLTGLGALAVLSGQRRASAAQVPDSCASTGDVCTLLYGCCSGLTCATSSINPSYGVCVPGEGGMVSTGTALVLPFDESDSSQTQTQTATTTTSTTTTTTTTDPQAERQARLETMRNRRRTNKDEQQTRRQTQQDRAQEKRDARDIRNGPDLSFDVVTIDPADAELVRVTNKDTVGAYITQLEPVRFTSQSQVLSSYVYITAGTSHLFRSARTELQPAQPGVTTWAPAEPVCHDIHKDGFIFSGAFSSTGTVTQYTVMCDGTLRSGNQRNKNKKSQNDQRERRKNKNQKSRGKGNGNGKGR